MAKMACGVLAIVALAACSESQDPAHGPVPTAPRSTPGPAAAKPPDRRVKLPTARDRVAALGNLAMLADATARAFRSDGFEPIRQPGAHDWLAEHAEPGQTFDQFVHARFQRPDRERGVIYLLPIGPLPDGAPPMRTLADYIAAYFQMPVKRLPAVALGDVRARRRNRPTGEQLLAPDVLDQLESRLPRDAYCLIGVTGADLYPDDDWNFVFGMATFRRRVGVYSLARYHPSFDGGMAVTDTERIMLRRALKVMAHEIGHMFGIEHCVYYECVQNGSNNLAETDARPDHPCPICLRKLHHAIGFDPAERYRDLAAFYRKHGLDGEAAWTEGRLAGD